VGDVVTVNRCAAFTGFGEAGDDPKRGGLACAIRTQKPNNFTGFYAERQIGDGRDISEAFG
jgi:hypothetical protein